MQRSAVWCATAVLCAIAAGACDPGDSRPAPATPFASPRVERTGAQEDAAYLVEQLHERHPDLFHSVSRRRFRRAADRFVERAGELSDEEFLVEAMRIVALPTLKGRDGHTGIFPTHTETAVHAYPLRLYEFTDGMFVVDALRPYRSLIGAEVTGVARHSMDDLRRTLYPLVSRDNASSLRARFPTMLTTAEVLMGSGVTGSPRARFRFELDGRRRSRAIEPIPMNEYMEWAGGHYVMSTLPSDRKVLYLSRLHAGQWARYLPGENLLYLQYNFVDDPTALIDAFERHVTKPGLRVVLDVRHNPGGDNTEYAGLVATIEGSRVDDPDSLFLIAGRATFSAAGNFVAEFLHETKATSVGEPSGGSPNQFGDSQVIELPNSGINAHVAVYYVEAVPGDDRRSIPPDIPAELSSADYFSRRDPAMEVVAGL